MEKKLKVAIVGTNGIPAAYGGYETLADNLAKQIGDKVDLTVYCSKIQKQRHYIESGVFNNAKLIYYGLKANGLQSLVYDTLSLIRSAVKDDVIIYLGPGAGAIVSLLRLFGCKKNIIVNHGGLNEWEREKFSPLQKWFTKQMHKCAAKSATYNIADNDLYRQSLKRAFGTDSVIIKYGGNHAKRVPYTKELLSKYPFLDKEYAVSVSRAQVDNNLHIVLEAYSRMPERLLVLVSNWQVSDYGKNLREKYYNKYPNIVVLDAIYNPEEINAIRSNAQFYIHSHSRCGTAPSLCEAMSLGLAIISFDVPVNHESTREQALFFKDAESLVKVVRGVTQEQTKSLALASRTTAEEEYKWSHIGEQYLKRIRKEI